MALSSPAGSSSNTADIEASQREYYNQIAAVYDAHHSDHWSTEYQRRFLNPPLIEGLDLAGKKVLDAMCGTGAFVGYLIPAGAKITALDISDECIKIVRERYPDVNSVRKSIFESGFPDHSFDVVFSVGGLHHLHPHVPEALDEIYRILKPGGMFSFMEPHTGSLPDLVRRQMYRVVKDLFQSNERAIDVRYLVESQAGRFLLERKVYRGNLAYLLIQNSLASGVPLGWKRRLAPALFAAEALVTPFLGEKLSCYVCCQLRRLS